MGAQAILLAKAVDYESAGTVEFIVDKHQNFYFLEMNTRLQVEHPVTEMITGIDLVEQMIRIASGENLKIKQDNVKTNGWSIESRVYAEDPYRDFMPSIGRLEKYLIPEASNKVRVDTGIREGSEVSMFYDPMIAKLITHGQTRDSAIENMVDAIDQYVIDGLSHNLNFLSSIMQNKTFKSGNTTTDFIEQEYAEGFNGEEITNKDYEVYASVMGVYHLLNQSRINQLSGSEKTYVVDFGDRRVETSIKKNGANFMALIGGNNYEISLNLYPNDPRVICRVNEEDLILQVRKKLPHYEIIHRGNIAKVLVSDRRVAELNQLMPEKIPQDMSKFLLSPMPGLLIKVCIEEGQTVKAGEELAVVEAMKMENSLRASKDLKIKSIL